MHAMGCRTKQKNNIIISMMSDKLFDPSIRGSVRYYDSFLPGGRRTRRGSGWLVRWRTCGCHGGLYIGGCRGLQEAFEVTVLWLAFT